MIKKLALFLQLIQNMGIRYIGFRIWYEFKLRSGIQKKLFPTKVGLFQLNYTLNTFQKSKVSFFFDDKNNLNIPINPTKELEENAKSIIDGTILFFNAIPYSLGKNYNWLTNPDTGYTYDIKKHWTEIPDYAKENGDIKFVWEKSRFSYIDTLLRYDYHFKNDQSEFVIQEIISWIDANPTNMGPNYRCSQEISIRLMNWMFALHYYKNAKQLSDERFNKIIQSIYWQIKHVERNIHFSRIAVRNNHAISETFCLLMAGILFPELPGSKKWLKQGKKYFEQEIAYQVYNDGTFLQFSMNYHRVVLQLMTWALRLCELNQIKLSEVVTLRAIKSCEFIEKMMQNENGFLPNYGANDGALFFKFNDAHFRDYRPQLNALKTACGLSIHSDSEDAYWFGMKPTLEQKQPKELNSSLASFPTGGYYAIEDHTDFTFIRCGNHKDRPSQADNLHIDIWHKGVNILRDGGSYKYNTDEKSMKFFFGTESHNTIMLNEYDQMKKGSRFIWYDWTQCIDAEITEDDTSYIFSGTISAYKFIHPSIKHKRIVKKHKNKSIWEITDEILNKPEHLTMRQLWHPDNSFFSNFSIESKDQNQILDPIVDECYYSPLYGIKEQSDQIQFNTKTNIIQTIIKLKS